MAGDYSQVTMGTEFWAAIFGRLAPVEVEIGPGTGTFLLSEAAARGETNFYAIEASRSRAERLTALIEKRDLRNVRVVHAPAQCVVRLIPDASVTAYHMYFPDPWWKRRHHKRRLFTPGFARELARTLVPGGRVYVATDVLFVWDQIREYLEGSGLPLSSLPVPPRATPTAFERKGLRRGAPIWEGTFVRPSAASAATQAPRESWHTVAADRT